MLSRMRRLSLVLVMLLAFLASCQPEAQSDESVVADLSSVSIGGRAVELSDGWTYYTVIPESGSAPAQMWRVKHGSKPEQVKLQADCEKANIFQVQHPQSRTLVAMMQCGNKRHAVMIEPSTGTVTKLMLVENGETVEFSDTKALNGWLVMETANGVLGFRPLVGGRPAAAPHLKLEAIVGHPVDKPCNLPCGQLGFPQVLSDGRLFLLATTNSEASWFLYSIDAERGTEHRIADGIKGPTDMVASSDGRTVFVATAQGIFKVDVELGTVAQKESGIYWGVSLTADGKALLVEEKISGGKRRLRRLPV